MAGRNWGAASSGRPAPFARPFTALPRILGIEPFAAFPTAVFLMSFLSFFIGTFLQLMWEDLPITEPM